MIVLKYLLSCLSFQPFLHCDLEQPGPVVPARTIKMPLAPLKDPWQQVPLLDDSDSATSNNNDPPVGEDEANSR